MAHIEYHKNMTKPSVSIIIPALNEAGNIEETIKTANLALEKQRITDFEILVIDDGSTDSTGKVADSLALKHQCIRVFHNQTPKGLGYNFRTGVFKASKNYVGWIPGDNQVLPESIQNIFEQLGKTDIVISYIANQEVRPLYRRILSFSYTAIFNMIFGLNLKYFNGVCFFKREMLKSIEMSTDSPAYMAEILVQLLKKNDPSYVEIPFYMKEREYGKSSVLKWKNVYMIGKTIISLFRLIKKPN